jgi:GNAT superfamily N-acetyltransferase
MNDTVIETVAPAAVPGCLRTLTRAFAQDPVARWIFPDPQDYAEWFPRLARAFAETACAGGTLRQARGGAATAVWLAPGSEPDDEALGSVFGAGVAGSRRAGVLDLFEQMAHVHPAEPCWYLPLLGVSPELQGRGLGSTLLSAAAATCDVQGLPAWVEATSPANVALYRRHGFEPVRLIQVPGGPTVTPMRRVPERLPPEAKRGVIAMPELTPANGTIRAFAQPPPAPADRPGQAPRAESPGPGGVG